MGAPQPHLRPHLVVDHAAQSSDRTEEQAVLAEFADESSLPQPALQPVTPVTPVTLGTAAPAAAPRRTSEIVRTALIGCLSAMALGASFAIGFGYVWSDRTATPVSSAWSEGSVEVPLPVGSASPPAAPAAVNPGVEVGSSTTPEATAKTPSVPTAPTPAVPTPRSISPDSRRQATREVATPNSGAVASTDDDRAAARTPAFSYRRSGINRRTQTPAASSKVSPSASVVAPTEPSAAAPAPPVAARAADRDASEASSTRAAAAPPTPAPATVRPNRADINAVNQALSQYQVAYSRKDVGAMAGIWPTVDARGVERAFAGIDRQALTLSDCRVTTAGNLATAVCDGRVLYVGRVGGRNAQERQGTWTIALERSGEAWQFVRLNVRDGQSGSRRPIASPKP